MDKATTDNVNSSKKIVQFFFGSYDGKIYSIQVDIGSKRVLSKFAFKVSENSIKVLCLNEEYIFASGMDEIIHIYDMSKKEDKGMIVTYAGSISNIQIVKNFLFAGGDEKLIPIWRMSDFNLVHNLKGHKGAITDFLIHQSGKFAVSASKDHSVVIWNLLTGVKITKYRFKNSMICHKLLFLKKEKFVVLVFDNEFWIFDLFKKSDNYEDWILKKVKVDTKICEAFVTKSKVCILHADGKLKIYGDIFNNENFSKVSLEKPKILAENELDYRVKFINITEKKEMKIKLLNVVFTNGEIYIYDLNKIIKQSTSSVESEEEKIVQKYYSFDLKTSDRITCLNSKI
jgi:WD40 repeat protein